MSMLNEISWWEKESDRKCTSNTRLVFELCQQLPRRILVLCRSRVRTGMDPRSTEPRCQTQGRWDIVALTMTNIFAESLPRREMNLAYLHWRPPPLYPFSSRICCVKRSWVALRLHVCMKCEGPIVLCVPSALSSTVTDRTKPLVPNWTHILVCGSPETVTGFVLMIVLLQSTTFEAATGKHTV